MRFRTALFATAYVLALADPARAFPPSPVTSTVPCGITLVGLNQRGVPDPAGAFTIEPRDIAGNPACDYSPLVLDFSGCPDVSICSVQTMPGLVMTCNRTKRTITLTVPRDLSPCSLTITLIGGVAHRSSPTSVGCMMISLGGRVLTDGSSKPYVEVAALDETGGDGLTPADLSLWLADYFTGAYLARSDFDHSASCSSNVGPTDLSLWLKSYFAGYVLGCNSLGGTLCP